MKLKFDSGLEYQLEAIKSVTDCFEGLPQQSAGLAVTLHSELLNTGMGYNELGIGNSLSLTDEQVLKNLQTVQSRNNVPKSRSLIETGNYTFPNFSVEMETGTGKTYVYLRSIFELNQLYGFKKFIIVVPSVAIREGVTSSIKLMKEHFKGLYNNVAFDDFVYQSKDLSRVRQFAVNNEVQIMVINIQAFQKDAGENVDYATLTDDKKKRLNVIHQEQCFIFKNQSNETANSQAKQDDVDKLAGVILALFLYHHGFFIPFLGFNINACLKLYTFFVQA